MVATPSTILDTYVNQKIQVLTNFQKLSIVSLSKKRKRCVPSYGDMRDIQHRFPKNVPALFALSLAPVLSYSLGVSLSLPLSLSVQLFLYLFSSHLFLFYIYPSLYVFRLLCLSLSLFDFFLLRSLSALIFCLFLSLFYLSLSHALCRSCLVSRSRRVSLSLFVPVSVSHSPHISSSLSLFDFLFPFFLLSVPFFTFFLYLSFSFTLPVSHPLRVSLSLFPTLSVSL